jgi:hypothetical protein
MSHTKCDKHRNGKKVRGEFVNRLAGGSLGLDEEREFHVCATIAARTKGMRRKKRVRSPVTDIRRSSRLRAPAVESDDESEVSNTITPPLPLLEFRTSPRRATFSEDIQNTRTSPRLNLGALIGYKAPSAEGVEETIFCQWC